MFILIPYSSVVLFKASIILCYPALIFATIVCFTESEINSIGSLLDIMFFREGYSVLPAHFDLSALQITDIITSIVMN